MSCQPATVQSKMQCNAIQDKKARASALMLCYAALLFVPRSVGSANVSGVCQPVTMCAAFCWLRYTYLFVSLVSLLRLKYYSSSVFP